MNGAVAETGAGQRHAPRKAAVRVATAVAVAAAFAFLTWADATGLGGATAAAWLLPLAVAVAAAGADEMRRLAARDTAPVPAWLAIGAGAAVPLAAAGGAGVFGPPGLGGGDPPLAAIGWAGGAVAAAFAVAVVREVVGFRAPGQGAAHRLATLCLVVVWVGLPVACLVALRVCVLERGAERPSILPLASLVAVVKAGDAAAYCVGSTTGRRRLAPALSPGKTWEGAAASLVGSLAVAGPMLAALPARVIGPWGGWVVYGVAVGVAGMLGDLAESLLKREAGRKDSGWSLGALGGVLDLIDSLLLAAPVAWLLWLAGRPGP
ncbi:MAG: phosphatidate cytidylyltransferase [Planctomycetia bacterium]|nr:phosphatidate cytidylyltransferase [Planctomycetia bacterium]